jgi:lysophospholipase L1-like esterase
MRHPAQTFARAAIGAVSALAILAAGAAPTLAAKLTPPNAMAALGDSITQASTTCSAIELCPAESWSTGTDPAVDSQYLRLLAINPGISGANFNFAVPGAQVDALQAEAALAVTADVGYVTVLIGANDACTSTVADMTPVSTFAADFSSAMQTLETGLPNAHVFVASIPDLYRLWQLESPNPTARTVWAALHVCQSMLANPQSMAKADKARRQAVLQREMDYNTQMQAICAMYANCKFDKNAVFNNRFSTGDIGTLDYFHPSIAGQASLAAVTWSHGFKW